MVNPEKPTTLSKQDKGQEHNTENTKEQ